MGCAAVHDLIDAIRPTRRGAYWDSATTSGVCTGACAGIRVVDDDAARREDCDHCKPPKSPSKLSMPSAGSSDTAGVRAFGVESLSSNSSISSSKSSTAAKLDRSLGAMRLSTAHRRDGAGSRDHETML
jgi:hypothetical protein